jgi:chemotaxis protein methyltransferase CheR
MNPDATGDQAPVRLSDSQFDQLREFLYQRAGLHFGDAKRFLLESRLQKRLKEMGQTDPAAYLAHVTSPGRGAAELRNLLDIVTTHETSFFRNRPQLDAFQKHVLRTLLDQRSRRNQRVLRIWSAACSSGEEPYTLAMMLIESMGEELKRWQVSILGTDIAQNVLEKARVGEYGRYSFRSTPAYFATKYFEAKGRDTFCIRDEVRRLVEFQALNFADEARMRMMRGFDVIFCRNALIYFDLETKRRFVAQFTRCLNDGGFFFVGHSESLHGVSDTFKLIHFPGALAYQKPLSQ